jgi:hypothetical protein
VNSAQSAPLISRNKIAETVVEDNDTKGHDKSSRTKLR